MTDACAICGHERGQGRCWRLTCPTNGASGEALAMMRRDLMDYGIHVTKNGRRIPPPDLFASVDDE